MAILRFVHLSDIHFGQEKDGKLVFYDDVRDQLISNCAQVRNELGPADGILITGDIAFSGKGDQYQRAGEWLDRLAETVGCSKAAVRAVPGNHDIDHDEINHWCKLAYGNMRRSSPQTAGEELAKCTANEEGNPLGPPVKAYREFSERYGCGFESIAKPIWQQLYALHGSVALRFIGLSSVRVSDREDGLGRLILGESQYILEDRDDAIQIVLFHHPFEYFMDRDPAKNYLTQRARVIMTGHEHNPKIQKEQSEDGTEWLIMSAGAASPPDSFTRYTYSWVEFSLELNKNSCALIVTVYPKVWSVQRTRFIADTSRFGMDSKAFVLACPNIKLTKAAIEPAMGSATTKDADRPAKGGDAVMPQYEDERFARLRYYFWHFLDWRQRLTVLAKIGVLSSIPDKALPQTMERIALNEARIKRKLSELWIAVMESVPADKREHNPYHSDQE